jgi:ATP-dependent RNA helicase RhlE
MNQGYVNLSRIEHFVLDEADRMLDMGFIHDVKKIFSKIPSKRQTLLFSATMPKEVLSLSNFLLKDPIRISVAPVSATAEKVNQKVFFVDQKSKRLLLKSLLKNDKIDISSVLVFTRTKHGANRVVKDLTKNNITAQAIHGNKSQNARQNALDNFKKRITRVLVATDIAARGIDIDDLSHVINYDIPNIPETYVHRIGRTGRAGNSGIAWSFVDTEERKYLSDIQKLIKKEIEIEINHEFLPQSNAGTEKRVQKSKRNSSNEKKFKKNKLKKMQSQKKYHEKKSPAVSGLEKNNSRKENDTSYWGSDSSGSGGAFTKPKN